MTEFAAKIRWFASTEIHQDGSIHHYTINPDGTKKETTMSDEPQSAVGAFTVFGPDGLMEGFNVEREAWMRALKWAGEDMDAVPADAPIEHLKERLSTIIETTGEPISVKVS